MRELETMGRAHRSADAASTSDGSAPAMRSFHLRADSPDALRIARETRRLKVAHALLLSAVLAVPLALVALTVYWIWLKAA